MSVIQIDEASKRFDRGKKREELMYLSGATVRLMAVQKGGDPEHLFDTDGTPILVDEMYEVSWRGLKRIE